MLEVRLLGQFEIKQDGRVLTIPTRNAQSLFAYLVLNPGKAHRREMLAGLLWPDSSEGNARSNLRHELWRLRKAVEQQGESYFAVDDLSLTFNPPDEYALDVQQLESVPLEEGTPEDLMEGLSGYQGELLPGFYEDWAFAERNRLQAVFEARMARLLEILQEQGRWGEVLDWSLRWITQGQWPEPAYRALISAYASRGDLSKAVATYQHFSQGLQKDLGVRPSEQTQALYKRLKAGGRVPDPLLTVRPPITQAEAAAPAFTIPRMRRSNLPRPLTSFIGREKEIQAVKQLVSKNRLVTIIGSGGVGKTRLAIQAAGSLAPRFKDGVCWVELASLLAADPFKKRDPMRPTELEGADLVAQAVAKSLRAPEIPGFSLLEGMVEYLYDKQLLLVLDNCEHLIAACAAIVEYLLDNCPELAILVTSREALGVPGERGWSLPSLSLPEKEHSHKFSSILQSEAVSLFVERTAGILPGYQPNSTDAPTIAQICLQLDGIPLAIELAAARMNLLSAQEIAARLDRRFSLLTGGQRTALPHHQTLLAAIEWSYDLLSDPEQVLFRRLSIFADSFTLEAAEDICAGEAIRDDQVLTLLARLVDKSLLQVDPGLQDPELATRYRFLDTIRSLGRLKLEEADESRSMSNRHAAYYLRLAETAAPELLMQNQAAWYKLLQAETGNIRAVIDWSMESDQAESALRIMGAMLWFWWSHGSVHEGIDLAYKALALPSAARFQTYRARTLNLVGILHWALGELHLAHQLLEEAESILRASDDKVGLTWSLQFLGMVLTSEGEYGLADAAMQESIAIARQLGDLSKSSFSLAFVGDIPLQQGDRTHAQRVYRECADMLHSMGNKLFAAYPTRRLGYLALEDGDLQHTRPLFWESLMLNREGNDRRGVAASLTSLAALAQRLDKPVLAARLMGVVESQLESLSLNLLYLDQVELSSLRSQMLTHLGQAAFTTAFFEGWGMSEARVMELAGEV